jgi:hypothetical protein
LRFKAEFTAEARRGEAATKGEAFNRKVIHVPVGTTRRMKIHFHKKSHRHGVEAKTEENIYRRGAEFAETRAFIHKKSFTSALSASLRCCFRMPILIRERKGHREEQLFFCGLCVLCG